MFVHSLMSCYTLHTICTDLLSLCLGEVNGCTNVLPKALLVGYGLVQAIIKLLKNK